ncbi:MAG TPA: NADH-quinone oxidoreductase subunit C [candidate division WOR-3 bacterium]|uniref:NADH-quinone oxidoreductase subunit C n=1 Tax=candidate division WOR-3 bacterium TaxID=2052148 RepID=A0A9C9EKP3_UNCW3|nr:NADH-quinone oxidoreductase subunit C [candidate division WOR-3 bacterium]
MMKKEYSKAILEEISKKFPDVVVKIHSARRIYIRTPREKVFELAKFMFEEKGFRLSIATGIDTRDGIEIIYHFSFDEAGTYYNIKTLIPKDDLKIKSLTSFLPAANWIEREIHELLGVDFVGHPNLVPLLTAETWPADLHPLCRDYANEHKDIKIKKKP